MIMKKRKRREKGGLFTGMELGLLRDEIYPFARRHVLYLLHHLSYILEYKMLLEGLLEKRHTCCLSACDIVGMQEQFEQVGL